MKKLLYLLFAICIFTACSDDDKDKPDPAVEELLGDCTFTGYTPELVITDNREMTEWIKEAITERRHYYKRFIFGNKGEMVQETIADTETRYYKVENGLLYITDVPVAWAYYPYEYIVNDNNFSFYSDETYIFREGGSQSTPIPCKIDTVITSFNFIRPS